MEPEKQFCDNPDCPDYGKVGAGNIRIHSHKERRYRCLSCRKTFSETKGTFFYRLRTNRKDVLEAIAMLVERNSIRAIARIKGVKANTILHWLDLAGQHAAEVSEYLIRDLHLTQAQVDELWTFIKKSRRTSPQRTPTLTK